MGLASWTGLWTARPGSGEEVTTQRDGMRPVEYAERKGVAHPARFERATFAFGGQRSIQLSYGCLSR
jgi:hypothetical protein